MSRRYQFLRHLVFLRHFFWEAYKERILLSIVATVLFGSIISIVNKVYYGIGFWHQFLKDGDIDNFFCEMTDMNQLVRQPVNTFTNFIYLIMTFYCFSKGLEDIKQKRAYNLITANRFYSFALSGIMFYTFVCSSLFHASLIKTFSMMDFSAVYSISLFPLMYFTHRVTLRFRHKPTNMRYSNERYFLILFFGTIYTVLTFNLDMTVVHPVVTIVVLLIITCGIYLERKDPHQTNLDYLIAAIVSILLAGLFFEMDIKHIMCHDLARITPHSLWHIFNGMSIFFFYLYIRSERYDYTLDSTRQRLKEKAGVVQQELKSKN